MDLHVAQVQNRRKLLPDDVSQVCSTREQFLFLREDIKDLVREQLKEKEAAGANLTTKKSAVAEAAAANSKPLTSYFSKLS